MSETEPTTPVGTNGVGTAPVAAAPAQATAGIVSDPLVEYLIRHGDDRLVLGHRLSEWCGHAPILEEDIALGNIALDLLGQATSLLGLAAEQEGKGRDADALAFFREAVEFRNVQLVELPRGDFAVTLVRQFLFDAYDVLVTEALSRSAHAPLAGVMAKAHKEARYHVRHSGEWVVRLGDGTDESHRRAQRALDDLWRFTSEPFLMDDVDRAMLAAGIGADLDALRPRWEASVREVMTEAGLQIPGGAFVARGGRTGRHTEHLGHMLAEMQIVARSHPGATW
ncbi:1,2-phenylacetyl-CoA epoxidase subunit PaaC [Roseisolibacter agri]|uniref:1,2-phenylacetyl-CoA epoxidase subunit PaaC n=1 Tax=Roseisolibacter agri TaxID=2014610 RepID=UPI0024E0981E|nr:1,2-phenylacetyl-CoA epoxidase subunit PaaC [Roseisolibacter agri]